MNIAIIIPVLNPDEKTTTFIDRLLEEGFKNIIVIDDGSNEESQKYFDEIRKHPECTVLVHEVNRGKGAALKTAFSYLAENRPDIEAAVTADGDGQHDTNSIKNCLKKFSENRDAVIFGGRDFSDKENIPWQSRYGNKISSVVYRFSSGINLKDTQTGLRVIPSSCFERFSKLNGDRYEYETEMIIDIASNDIPYHEVPITTIYINDNESSHFNYVRDSVKIYVVVLKNLAKFLFNSLLSWVIDEGFYYLFLTVLAGSHEKRTLLAVLFARILSSIVNYALNRKTVFKSHESVWKTALKYYILAACMLAISMGLVDIFAVKILKVDGFLSVLVKCVVDIVLFALSYTVQRKWVFKKKNS